VASCGAQAPAHATGQGAGIGLGFVRQAHHGEDLHAAAFRRGHAVEPGLEFQQLIGREKGIDVQLLGYDADGGPEQQSSLPIK